MTIRNATHIDIPRLVEIDQKAYENHGAKRDYFLERLKVFPQGVLVVEDTHGVSGFAVLELVESDGIPVHFTKPKTKEQMKGRWTHIIAFTTHTNYRDKNSDSQLLHEAEKKAMEYGCQEAYVPLSIDHPFEHHGVFDFWKENGYQEVGSIDWIASKTKKISCKFLGKKLLT